MIIYEHKTKKVNEVLNSEVENESIKESAFLSNIPAFATQIKEGEKERFEEISVYNPNEEW